MRFEENMATQIALNKFLWYDFEHEDIPGKEYIETLETASPFADKLREIAVTHCNSGELTDDKKIIDFLLEELKTQGIINEENYRVSKSNLTNWLGPKNGNSAPVMPGKRESVYQICFALQLNEHETGEFFVKGYLERPYNFKDLKETVYYYCLKNKLNYSEALELYQTVKEMPCHENPSVETDTSTIGSVISNIDSKDEFIDYIQQNRWLFETKSLSAKKAIADLIKDCIPLAENERNTFNFSERQEAIANRDKKMEEDDGKDRSKNFDVKPPGDESIVSAEALLSVIYGYYAREVRVEEKKTVQIYNKTLNKDSQFPRLIREKMVSNAMQLSALQKGTASDSITRSALILFIFYYFFSKAKFNATEGNWENTIELFDEFVDFADNILLKCGYGQLYWRNPYDWMIGYCAKATNPVDQLRLLIDEFFLDDETVIN